jgi:ceramide glucosyltransferase
MNTLTSILLASASLGVALYLGAFVSTILHVRSRKRQQLLTALPAISLLKPIKGLEEQLEKCLRSLYEQEYPGEREVVFSSATRDDPALSVARKVAAAFPHVPTRFVRSDDTWGFNPKVSNLQGALVAARHDLVLQTDANVWAEPGYLQKIVSEFISERASLLSSLVTGSGEMSAGAAMENIQLGAFTAPGCCMALKLGGMPCVIGKSMLLRKSELRELGGLAIVKDSLAEDFLLGKHYMAAGKKVVLSATPIRNVNANITIERHVARHARWLKMRAVLHAPAFIAELFVNPVALLMFGWIASGLDSRLGIAMLSLALVKMLGDGMLIRMVRGNPMPWRYLWLAPVKDLLMIGTWAYSSFSRSIDWRGVRLRLGPDSLLMPDQGAFAVRLLRRILSP